MAFSQSIEEYEAPINRGESVGSLPSPEVKSSTDDRALGASLTQLEIVNPRETVGNQSFAGAVDLSRAGSVLQTQKMKTILSSYIGKELSKKVIFDIRAAITNYYRSVHRPLVSVIIPPQEVTSGTLKLTVLPFQLGEKRVEGAEWTPDEYIKRVISLKKGEEINGEQLISDVNWLNRNPYRNSEMIFEPGAEPGTTDVVIRSKESRPWSAYAGYVNSGSNTDDMHRLFAGFSMANFPTTDAQLSYQFTGSPISMSEGRIFDLGEEDGLLSHSGSLWVPLSYGNGWHHSITMRAGHSESYSAANDFIDQGNVTNSFYADYGIQMSNLGVLTPELYAGFDYKRQNSKTYFFNAVSSAYILDVFNGVVGVRGNYALPIGTDAKTKKTSEAKGDFDLRLVYSPGDIGTYNDDASFIAANSDPDATATYAYLNSSVSFRMPLQKGFSFGSNMQAQLAFGRIPGVERFQIGGDSSVRGYLSGEQAGDSGYAVQSTLYAPAQNLFKSGNISDALVGYVFADFGGVTLVNDLGTNRADLASIGFGMNYQVGRNFTASFNYGYALTDARTTENGDSAVSGRVTFRY